MLPSGSTSKWLRAILFVIVTTIIPFTPTSSDPLSPDSYITNIFQVSALASDEFRPDIAYNSKHNEYLVVWENMWGYGGAHDVYAQRISATGKLLSWFDVSTSGYNKKNPSVAYDPTLDRYLIVFAYDAYGTDGDWDVYGRFIPWNGPDAGLSDFVICNWTSNQYRPVVAFGHTQNEFLVTWTNAPAYVPTYISARRVNAGGGFPDEPFTISSGPDNRDYQDVTYNLHRNEYLVTWDVDKADTGLDIYGIRLRGDGFPLTGGDPSISGEFPIAGWPDDEERPAVAACDKADQYLVAWQSDQGTGGSDFAIYARFLNGDAVPGYLPLISDTPAPQMDVDLACNSRGDGYLLAWQDKYVGGEFGIWGRLAYPNGSLGSEFELVGPRQNADREFPGLAGGSSNYLVAWEHDRDGGSNKDIYGRIIGYFNYLPLVLR